MHVSLRYKDKEIIDFFANAEQSRIVLEDGARSRPPDLVLWLDSGAKKVVDSFISVRKILEGAVGREQCASQTWTQVPKLPQPKQRNEEHIRPTQQLDVALALNNLHTYSTTRRIEWVVLSSLQNRTPTSTGELISSWDAISLSSDYS